MTPPSAQPLLKVERINDVTIARFPRPSVLTDEQIEMFGEQVLQLMEDPRCRTLVLSFNNISTMATGMLSGLIRLNKRARALGRQLAFCSLTPAIYETISVLQLTQVFRIYGDEQEAIQSFA
jgi:anti-anti-sigma factor